MKTCLLHGRSIIRDDITGELKQEPVNIISNYMFFHVTTTYTSLHHLYLLVDQSETFRVLDLFLRAIWLECCGHLSSFYLNGQSFESDMILASEQGRMGLDYPIKDFMGESDSMIYEYDFGSTTALKVTLVQESVNFQSDHPIIIVGRNEFNRDREASPRVGECGYAYNPDFWSAFEFDFQRYKGSKNENSHIKSSVIPIDTHQNYQKYDDTIDDEDEMWDAYTAMEEAFKTPGNEKILMMLEKDLNRQKEELDKDIQLSHQLFYQELKRYERLPDLETILSNLKVKELKELAGSIAIKKYTTFKKNALVALLKIEFLNMYKERLKLMDTNALALLKEIVEGEGRDAAHMIRAAEFKHEVAEVLFSAFHIVTARNKQDEEPEFVLPREIYELLKAVDWSEYTVSGEQNHRIVAFMNGYLELYGVMHTMDLPEIYSHHFSEDILQHDIHGILAFGSAFYQCYSSKRDYYYSIFLGWPEELYAEQWQVREYNDIKYKSYSTEDIIQVGDPHYVPKHPVFHRLVECVDSSDQAIEDIEMAKEIRRVYTMMKTAEDEIELSLLLYQYKEVLNFRNLKETYEFADEIFDNIPNWKIIGCSYNEINGVNVEQVSVNTSSAKSNKEADTANKTFLTNKIDKTYKAEKVKDNIKESEFEKTINPYKIVNTVDHNIRNLLNACSVGQLCCLIQNNGIKMQSIGLSKSILVQIMESVYLQRDYKEKALKKIKDSSYKVLKQLIKAPIRQNTTELATGELSVGLIELVKFGMVFISERDGDTEFFVSNELKILLQISAE